MEFLEDYTKFNNAFFTLQMEVNAINDKEKAQALVAQLFVMQTEFGKMMTKIANAFEGKTASAAPSTETAGRQLLCDTTIPDKGTIQFTKQEICKMPKKFQKILIVNGNVVSYRRRTDGWHNHSYELRLRRGGYNISASAPTLKDARAKFIEKINNYNNESAAAPKIPRSFDGFSMYYFENFRKRKIGEKTYKNDLLRYRRYLLPTFGSMQLKDITAAQCQALLDSITAAGKGKTCDEVHSLLNQTLNMAVRHGLIARNPIDIVFHETHQRQHGKALTKDEEKKLLSATAGTPYQLMFAVALYTGLRPNEFKTAQIDGDFIVAVNSKQKDGKIHYKKIPITPMLRPYLDGVLELKFYCVNRVGEKFRTIIETHKLYDLRTTFYTRCVECGVAEAAREKFMGHSLKGLQETYTDLSDDFLLREAEKLRY